MATLPIDPWANDKFDRKRLAEDLVAYIDSATMFGPLLGESKSLVIGVDAPYGFGKTFFLTALKNAEQGKRAVAYVDAWADDLIDDPLVSVAATVKEAISPWLDEPAVKRKWDETAKKAGKVATIATKGIAKQLLKLAISDNSVTAIEAVLDNIDEEAIENFRSSVEDGFDSISENISEMNRINQDKYLDSKIENLQEMRRSVSSLRASLESLAIELEKKSLKVPIIIIIDELDRCRPKYAIKLLEEIKHIFSSNKVCFILGVNSEQLSKSIAAEYGAHFDGSAYLDRFIDRFLNLPFPNMDGFIAEMWGQIPSITQNKY